MWQRRGKVAPIAPPESGKLTLGVSKRRPNRVDQILDVAVTLFDRNGYYATGMDNIGSAAGLTGPAIYRHFKSKEEILARLVTERATRSLERATVIAMEVNGPNERLHELIEFYVDELVGNPELARVAFYDRRTLSGATKESVMRLERRHIDIWIRALRDVRPDLTAPEARVIVQGMVGMAVAALAVQGRGIGRMRVRELIADMMLASMFDLSKGSCSDGR